MILKSVWSKMQCARARSGTNLSRRGAEGRAFSSSASPSPKDTSLGMPALFAVTLIGGTAVYIITDIVKYIIHSRRLAKIKERDKVYQLYDEKVENLFGGILRRFPKRRD